MNILFVASECVPFSKVGGLADVVGALPKALVARGHQISVAVPRYRQTPPAPVLERRVEVRLGPRSHVAAIQQPPDLDGVRYFLVDYPPFFDRDGIYTTEGRGYPDNAERFALFCHAVLELLKRTQAPDLIHCHDWQTSLIPVLLKSVHAADPVLGSLPTILTVHNLGYQGAFPPDTLDRIGLPRELLTPERLEAAGKLNYLKGGLLYADFVTTVSKKYAQEIQTAEYGHKLDHVVRRRAATVAGILNGADYSEWNPQTDPHLAAPYSAANLEGKSLCKKDLLEQFGLPGGAREEPLVGIVSRFAAQKGFDLIAEVADALMQNDLQLVALGTGEPRYEELFRRLAQRFPAKVGVRVAYDNALAHKIEGGSDMFLMPSRYEPCGLNQIYSMKYGTVPVARATGGLDDTIQPFDPHAGTGTGFKFAPYSGQAMLDCLTGALRLYAGNPPAWRTLMLNGMQQDFSWDASAAAYERLYQQVAQTAPRPH